MILQKFVPTLGWINHILDEGYGEDFQQLFSQFLDDHTFLEIDMVVDRVSSQISESLELLSEQKSMNDCVAIIRKFSFNEKVALNQYLVVAALYKGFHVEKLPLFPLERLPFNFYAYLEASYQDFCYDCQQRGVSVAEEVFALSLDNFEQQNI